MMGTALDAPGSPFWGAENAIRDSELSGNLAHELPPLPGPVVTLFHSTHLSSLEGSRRKTAALWVSAIAKAFNYLFCAGGQRDSLSRFLALLTLPKLKNLAFAGGWISSSTFWSRFAECGPCPYTTQAWLLRNWPCCSLCLVSRDSMVGPAVSKRTHGTSPGRSFLRRRAFE